MTGKLTLGMIGAGTWGIGHHLPAFVARPDVEPLIVCRRDPELLEVARAKFGFPRATTDWREVIAAKPDMVSLPGPVGPRAEQIRAALEAGIHVLAEKPLVKDPADAWALEALAREKGLVLMVCYGYNETEAVNTARRLLREDGGVGTIEHVTCVMASGVRDLLTSGRAYPGSSTDSPPRAETWGDPQVSGGGYGQGQLTHGLGLLFRLIDEKPTHVAAFTNHGPGEAVELHDAIALKLENGITGTISGAAFPPATFGYHHQVVLTVTGSEGQLQIDMDRNTVRRSTASGEDILLEIPQGEWSFRPVIDRFVDLVAGKTTENRSPGELGARVVDVLDAMQRSADTGTIIRIR